MIVISFSLIFQVRRKASFWFEGEMIFTPTFLQKRIVALSFMKFVHLSLQKALFWQTKDKELLTKQKGLTSPTLMLLLIE
jgi:hypothetical protein